jgi:hypothetical protein
MSARKEQLHQNTEPPTDFQEQKSVESALEQKTRELSHAKMIARDLRAERDRAQAAAPKYLINCETGNLTRAGVKLRERREKLKQQKRLLAPERAVEISAIQAQIDAITIRLKLAREAWEMSAIRTAPDTCDEGAR